MFRNIGWENFLNLMAHTYRLHTREFFADCGLDNERIKVAFQLMGEPILLDFARVNDIMGLPSTTTFVAFDSLPPEFNHDNFWTKITGGIFSYADRDKATSFIQPCLHIAHRILVCTVFTRKEAGKVTNIELFFLWCMTRCDNPPIPDFA